MKKKIRLRDGTIVDNMGIGTWYMGEDKDEEKNEIKSIKYAIENGIKLIDTAEMYGNGMSEILVGKAIKEYDRDKIFLVSKVLPQHANEKNIFNACHNSLKRLNTDFLDLYLLHWRGIYAFEETFQAMEKLKQEGKIKRWGVSNMDIDDMLEIVNTPFGDKCQVNQVLYHLGSRGIEYSLKKFTDSKNIATMAYCPLAQGGRLKNKLLSSVVVQEIAKKYNITSMQVLLAFVLSQENMIAIPKAAKLSHMKENIQCLDIKLRVDDLKLLDKAFPAPKYKQPLDIE